MFGLGASYLARPFDLSESLGVVLVGCGKRRTFFVNTLGCESEPIHPVTWSDLVYIAVRRKSEGVRDILLVFWSCLPMLVQWRSSAYWESAVVFQLQVELLASRSGGAHNARKAQPETFWRAGSASTCNAHANKLSEGSTSFAVFMYGRCGHCESLVSASTILFCFPFPVFFSLPLSGA